MKVQDFDELRSKESQDTGKGSVYFIYIFSGILPFFIGLVWQRRRDGRLSL